MIDKSFCTSIIKDEAHRLGFSYCGISAAQFLDEEAGRLDEWLNRGMHGAMGYMERNRDKRLDPRKFFPGAKSIISVLLNYYSEKKQKEPDAPKISMYALGKRDYHFVMKEKLNELLHFIKEKIPVCNGIACVDSMPVMDKVWAQRSGLGWIGKNTNLLNKNSGSFFFIGELIVDIELEYDNPVMDYCGTCTRCIDACPTGAIAEPYAVDGSKCISYFTIELKENVLPEDLAGKFQNRAFGCDICQDVCPWNRFSEEHSEPDFEPVPEILTMNSNDWKTITEEKFNGIFKNSALKRAGFKGLQRNIRFLTKRTSQTHA